MNQYPTLFKVGDSVRFERRGVRWTGIIKRMNRVTAIVRTTCMPPLKEQLFRVFHTDLSALHSMEPAVRYIICPTLGNLDPLDTTYGPFETIDDAEAWAKKHGMMDEPQLYWEFRILELKPTMDQDQLDEIAEFRKANGHV